MIRIGAQPITEICLGTQGIKEAYVGESLVYRREGSHIFIELIGGYVPFIHKESTGLICADGSGFNCKITT